MQSMAKLPFQNIESDTSTSGGIEYRQIEGIISRVVKISDHYLFNIFTLLIEKN